MGSRELLGSRKVVTSFFADCAPCIRDVPALNAFIDKHPGCQELAITHDQAECAARFKAEDGVRRPILVKTWPYLSAKGVQAPPQFALQDAARTLLSTTYGGELGDERGTVTLRELEAWIKLFT